MIVACPSCQQKLSVLDSMAGQQARCATCGTVFLVGGPTAPPRPMSATAPRNLSGTGGTTAAIIAIFLGCLLAITAFFVPWWTITITPEKNAPIGRFDEASYIRTMMKKVVKDSAWYVNYSGIFDVDELTNAAAGNRSWTGRIWGWGSPAGITALVAGAVLSGIMLTLLCPVRLRPWSWVGMLICGLAAIPVLVLSLLWIIVCPGGEIAAIATQGVHMGPFLGLSGGFIIVVGGLWGGMTGVLAKVKA